ncbi:MAG: PAS domain S-box protein, partial [Actinomycetota bacterium]
FGYPVLETAGAVKAVVFAQLDAGRLGEIATQAALAEGAAVAVIDANGTVLAAAPEPGKWVGRSFPRSPLVREVFSGIEGIAEVAGLDRVPRIYAYTWVGLSPATGMRVAVGIPKEEAFAAISRSFNRSLVGLGIVAALALFATRAVADRTILQRVKALVGAARRVSEGDLSARSGPPYGTGELGELAHAFDEMTRALQTRHVNALEAESQRRAADARFERIVDSASDAIMAVDANQEIILFNRAAERIFGYRSEAIRGRRLDFLLPSYRLDHLDEEREPPVQSGRNDRDPPSSEPRKVQARRKDWNIFPAEVSVSRLSEDPRITHTIILRDVTERVTAEARLEASLRALRRTNEERKRLLDRLVKAQEEERKRIAADVHDDSIQAMAAASMRMALLRRSVTDPGQLARCRETEEIIRAAIVRLRNLVFQLRPPMLDQQGLAGALEAFLEQVAVTAGFSYEVQSHLIAEPPSQVRLVLYLIAQEALVNISKHARATKVVVRMEDREEGFYIRIRDDGVGFSLEETAEPIPGHLGLSSMRERAEMLGGWWQVRSIPGDGTTVECWVPTEGGQERPEG